jgi:exopolyphosphatase / guanosine-5'-triphosphate,3'-diphosphate pyrophosphatase
VAEPGVGGHINPAPRAPAPVRRVGVIDIGSNSIRLVVFEGHPRAPYAVFNEKVLCGLGRSLDATGRLDPEGVTLALQNLPRFMVLAEELEVASIQAIATAAVRDAKDGPAFAREVERLCGLPVTVLGGDDEARLSAYGVIAGNPEAEGLMGDLGGGSLELVSLAGGGTIDHATLPLGPFRLNAVAARGKDPERVIRRQLGALDWLAGSGGGDFHAVGGAWRALARIHMTQTGYPLGIIDRYAVSRGVMEDIVSLISGLSRESLERLPGLPRRRLDALPAAALVMRDLIQIAKPKRVVFSAYGLREGVLFDSLSDADRKADPLLAAARVYADHFGRFKGMEDALVEWSAPLFPNETPHQAHLRRTACILADIGWTEHPSYRATHSFERALRISIVGLDHPGRAFLATVMAGRYASAASRSQRQAASTLGLEAVDIERAVRLGLALRLAIVLSGGRAEALADTSLDLGASELALSVGPHAAPLMGEMVERRLKELASVSDRGWRIETRSKAQKKAS